MKKRNNNGSIGNYGDCQKEYFSYALEPIPNTGASRLIRTNFYENLDDHLEVDSYRVYELSYYGDQQLLERGDITPESIIYFPCGNSGTNSYQIRFYSSNCINSEEHYISGNYSWMECPIYTGVGLSILSLEEKPHY